MPPKVTLRYQRVSDAKRFYEILDNPNFTYFRVRPDSVEAEREFLRQNAKRRKENHSHNYSILYGDRLIGGCGIKIDQHRKFIGEIGYFIDEAYWGRGIAVKAVRLLEKIGFEELGIIRMEIRINTAHKNSERVAIKAGYIKEGTFRKAIGDSGEINDAHVYAKIRD